MLISRQVELLVGTAHHSSIVHAVLDAALHLLDAALHLLDAALHLLDAALHLLDDALHLLHLNVYVAQYHSSFTR